VADEQRRDDPDRPIDPRSWEESREDRPGEDQPTRARETYEQPATEETRPQETYDQPASEQTRPHETYDQPATEEPSPHETYGDRSAAESSEQAYHDEPGGPGDPERMSAGDGYTDQRDADQRDADQRDAGEEDAEQHEHERGEARVAYEPDEEKHDDEYRWHTGQKRDHGSEDAVEFIDVVKAFGRNRVLNGLNLGLPDNQISMILGPSGTGKSVCIKHMVGLLYPDEGDVLVHGESVPSMADDDLFEMRKKFGVLFQDGALFGSMNVFDNTAFPLRQHTDKGDDEIRDIVMRRLKEVGLAGAADKMPNELSGGMRKRAGFARALVLDPDVVLFDEPDSGLDPVRTALLCELIQEVHEENGGAYVVITHDIMSARRVADYIAVLWKGRIVESGPASELFNSDNQFVRQFLSGEAQGPLGME
jgi:phospholipid/cholesterol/gamma-HCH transport system ATP-binding protein